MFIGIREARPGMILAEDIELPKGAGMLQKSRQLSGEAINLLLRSGISRINIVDPVSRQAAPPGAADAAGTAVSPGSPGRTEGSDPVPPQLKVFISSDAMSARLVLEPAGRVSQEISREIILEALEKAGILFGINADMVNDVVQKWRNNKRHYEFDRIAKGAPAEPGKEGNFHLKVKYLGNVADVETIHHSKFYWQICEKIGRPPLVAQSTVLAEKLFDTPPIPGSNIRAEPLITEQVTPSKISLGEGVAFSQERRQIVAKAAGIPYHINETIGILSINLNGSVDVAVDADRMSASLVIHPPADGGGMPSERDIEQQLLEARVLCGIDKEAIRNLIAGFGRGQYPAEPVVVARGIPPQNGDNGKIEFLFNTETSLTPKLNPDGTVDYKSVEIINSVAKGQELARLNPPTRGTPGKNILGEEIPCKEGSPGVLPIGPNTDISPQNENTLVASVDGIVRYTGSHVEVCEGYVIKGDVDFSTGNITYEKSVVINGDIKAGFTVDCGGDLQVSGLIEDCTLNIGGNLLCKHGFIGQGKGLIDAKGDVNLGFLMNQSVKSRKSVNIAKEAINSTIMARQSIAVLGRPLSVAGGTLVARDSITVYSVGNQSGVRTSLEVGLDFTLAEELKKNEEQEADFTAKNRKLIDAAKRYQHLAANKKRFTPQEEMLFSKLKVAITKIQEQLRIIEEQKKLIEKKLLDYENAFIKIEHGAMPGTLFKIGERRFVVKEEIIGPKSVRLIHQEIRIL